MSREQPPPSFEEFARWVATSFTARSATGDPPQVLLAAARGARDEMLRGRESGGHHRGLGDERRNVEVLHLLAAASDEGEAAPSELTTTRGFRVSLVYEEDSPSKTSTICVLVQCPANLLERVQGHMAYLWNGSERFELGQFDVDGKAIGTLPAGIEITLSDFARGQVKLEEPEN